MATVLHGDARDEDWVHSSQGGLDLLLVLSGVALVLLGLAMAGQDYYHELQDAKALRTFGSTMAFDAEHRLVFVPVITWLVAAVSVGTLWRAWRIRRSPRLRRHARRQARTLLFGAAVLDLAFWLDTTYGLTAPHLVRAGTIDPLYALAGVLIAGSAWRIRSLIRPLPPLEDVG